MKSLIFTKKGDGRGGVRPPLPLSSMIISYEKLGYEFARLRRRYRAAKKAEESYEIKVCVIRDTVLGTLRRTATEGLKRAVDDEEKKEYEEDIDNAVDEDYRLSPDRERLQKWLRSDEFFLDSPYIPDGIFSFFRKSFADTMKRVGLFYGMELLSLYLDGEPLQDLCRDQEKYVDPPWFESSVKLRTRILRPTMSDKGIRYSIWANPFDQDRHEFHEQLRRFLESSASGRPEDIDVETLALKLREHRERYVEDVEVVKRAERIYRALDKNAVERALGWAVKVCDLLPPDEASNLVFNLMRKYINMRHIVADHQPGKPSIRQYVSHKLESVYESIWVLQLSLAVLIANSLNEN